MGQGNADWKKRYDSLLLTQVADQEKLRQALTAIQILEAEKKQWEQSKVLQGQIIHQQLGSSDGTVKKLEEEIITLKAEIKRLKSGDLG